MPKLKTNSGAAKRFKQRGSGSLKRKSANRNHILTKKAPKRKRQLRGGSMPGLQACDVLSVERMLCIK